MKVENKTMRMNFQRKLPIPQEVKKEFPLTEKMIAVKAERDEQVKAVFTGESDKFLLIVGPCSADHREPVLEYISRLRRLEDQVKDKIIIIPRIYTNKPRTTGQGKVLPLYRWARGVCEGKRLDKQKRRPGEAPLLLRKRRNP